MGRRAGMVGHTGPRTRNGGARFLGVVCAGAFARVASGECSVPHPHEPNYVLEGAELQYRLSNFFAGSGPPPLEEVFFSTQNLSVATQEELLRSCPGLLISAFIVLAEARLPVDPAEAADAIAKADELARRLPRDVYEAALEVWPVGLALESYSRAAETIGEAPRQAPVVHVVVAHCRESLAWLADGHLYVPPRGKVVIDLFIYEKCSRVADTSALSEKFRHVHVVPVDDGDLRCDECSAYLRHLVEYYAEPAEHTFFFQADAGDHLQWGYLALVMRTIEHHALTAGFVHLDHPRLVASLSPCRQEVFRRIFGRNPQRTIGSYCCAQFVVARHQILANPVERYEQMLQMLQEKSPEECHDIPGHSTHCLMFEVYWHALFGEPDELPERADNPRLPLCLRTRDLDNESYLPRDSLFLQLVLEV